MRSSCGSVTSTPTWRCRQYCRLEDSIFGEGLPYALRQTTRAFVAHLHDPQVALRRGSTLALGLLPAWLLLPDRGAVLQGLARATEVCHALMAAHGCGVVKQCVVQPPHVLRIVAWACHMLRHPEPCIVGTSYARAC